MCCCLLEGHLCVHFSLGCRDRSIRRPVGCDGGARTLSLSLKSPAAGQRRDQWDVLASKQVVRGSDDELTEEEFSRFHVLCVILSIVLRFSRSLHPGVCNKRKKTLLILCYALLM